MCVCGDGVPGGRQGGKGIEPIRFLPEKRQQGEVAVEALTFLNKISMEISNFSI